MRFAGVRYTISPKGSANLGPQEEDIRKEDLSKLGEELWRGKVPERSDSKAGWMIVHVLRTKELGERERKGLFRHCSEN